MNLIRAVGYVLCIAVVAMIALMLASAPAPALSRGPCSVTQARQADARAAARAREAHRVYLATVKYTEMYGANVGRWVRPARLAGWPWSQIPTLMLVVKTESGGNPSAWTGYYAGLMQFGKPWWENKWNPFIGYVNLSHGHKAWMNNGWAPWPWL